MKGASLTGIMLKKCLNELLQLFLIQWMYSMAIATLQFLHIKSIRSSGGSSEFYSLGSNCYLAYIYYLYLSALIV